MTKELTEKDRNVLKYEKRIGYVFSGLILSFGGLFNVSYFVMKKTELNYLHIGLIDLGIIFLAYLVCHRINHKINLDLQENKKELLKKTVDEKKEENSYEAGSGSLYIPGLGELSPKLWGQKMRETKKYFIISNDNKYDMDKETYDKLKKCSDFYIHIAKHSGTTLKFSKED